MAQRNGFKSSGIHRFLSMKKRIALLGSTGSIGTQSLDVIAANPDKVEVEVLTANNNINLLAEQAKKFQPNVVVIGNNGKNGYDGDVFNRYGWIFGTGTYLLCN